MRREWARRALRTFVQAALGYAAANAAGLIGEGAGLTKNALAALAVASVAAGIAALMNVGPESPANDRAPAPVDPASAPTTGGVGDCEEGESADE